MLVLGIRRGGDGIRHHPECHFDARDSRREHCRVLDVFDAASKETRLTSLIRECARQGAQKKAPPEAGLQINLILEDLT
jgi:hypothetical protein